MKTKAKGKKFTQAISYKKGIEAYDKEQLKDLIDRAEVIYMKEQKSYDDGTQSATIEIHFKPK